MTQRQIAGRVGVPVSTYKEWEYGRKIQGEAHYLKLSEALEMNLYTLLDGKAPIEDSVLVQNLQSLVEHLEVVRKLLVSSLGGEGSAFRR